MKKFLLLLVLLAGASPAFAQMNPCSEVYMPCPQNLFNPVGPARQYQDAVRRRQEQQDEGVNDANTATGPNYDPRDPYAGPPAPRSNVRRAPPGTPYYGQ